MNEMTKMWRDGALTHFENSFCPAVCLEVLKNINWNTSVFHLRFKSDLNAKEA
jgi:hypothetical protein